ncbi:MAG: hypothetical protein MK160_05090 [Rhodobacteraceae bacterium]|nr:hypothetical protein [Paracoccaceae bacterium]
MNSIGDMSLDFMLRARQAQIKSQIQAHSKEMTNGIASDIPRHVSGDLGAVSSIETSLNALERYRSVALETRLAASTMQSVLGQTQTQVSELATDMVASHMNGNGPGLNALGETAKQMFMSTVDRLNVQVAGRSLFAGTETKGPALLGAEDMLSDIEARVSSATTVADLVTAVDRWFRPGARFDRVGYQGGADNLAPLMIDKNTEVSLTARADDPAFREVMKGLALAYFATQDTLSLSSVDQQTVMNIAGTNLLSAGSALTDMQAELGAKESLIDATISQAGSRKTSLEMARSNLIGVDPFAAATALEDAQFQLESIYAVTARQSRLTLMDFLR